MPFRAFLLTLAILNLGSILLGNDEGVPNGSCIVEVIAPSDARITVDGRDYGLKRSLTFNGLKANDLSLTKIEARFADGTRQERQVWIGAGRRVRLPMQSAKVNRPELALQTGHQGTVRHAAFSKDGKFIVTALGSIAILWDTATGRQLQTYRGHTQEIQGTAINSDGSRVYTCSLDNSLVAWDRDSGRRLLTIACDCFSIALSPDGLRLAVGGYSDENLPSNLQLFDAISGQRIRYFDGRHGGGIIFSVCFSPDGNRLVTGALNHTAVVWDVSNGRKVLELSNHSEEHVDAVYSDDGQRIATMSRRGDEKLSQGDVAVWDAESGARISYRKLASQPQKIAFVPGAHGVALRHRSLEAANEWRGIVTILNGDTLEDKQSWSEAGDREARLVAFDAGGKQLFDGETLWDFASCTVMHRLAGKQSPVSAAIYVPEQSGIAVSDGQQISLIDSITGTTRWTSTVIEQNDKLDDLRVTRDGRQVMALVTNSDRSTCELVVWNAFNGESQKRFLVSSDPSADLAISADGRLALVEASDVATMWDVEHQQALRSFRDGDREVFHSAMSADGEWVIVNSGAKGFISAGTLYSAASDSPITRLSGRSKTDALEMLHIGGFSPDSRFAYCVGYRSRSSIKKNGVVAFFSTATGEPLRRFLPNKTTSIRSP